MALLDDDAPAPDPRMQRFMDNIGKMESSNNYGAVGPPTDGGRGLGKYQVLESNLPGWSRQVLGRSVTPEEFLKSPEMQDKVAGTILSGYVQKYGFEKAGQAWFAGEGGIGHGDRRDVLGTSTKDYGIRASAGLLDEPGPSAQPAPAGGEEAGAQPSVADRYKNLMDARESMQLTPQEEDLYMHHLHNLHGGKGYTHPDGSISTVFAQQSEFDGKTYLLPKVHDGRVVDKQEAEDMARDRGLDRHPSYGSPQEAEDRYKLMHNFMDQDVEDHVRGQQKTAPAPQKARTQEAQTSGLINME